MDTVTLTIDGRTLTVEKGTTVLQAALDNGIEIPYYCYHPALGGRSRIVGMISRLWTRLR